MWRPRVADTVIETSFVPPCTIVGVAVQFVLKVTISVLNDFNYLGTIQARFAHKIKDFLRFSGVGF